MWGHVSWIQIGVAIVPRGTLVMRATDKPTVLPALIPGHEPPTSVHPGPKAEKKATVRPQPALQSLLAMQAAAQTGGQAYGAATGPSGDAGQLHSAALNNAHNALLGAARLLEGKKPSPGRVQARLKAVNQALQALPEGTDLRRLRGAAAQLLDKAPPSAAATALEQGLNKADAGRVLQELKSASPTSGAKIDALIAHSPEPTKFMGMLSAMYPGPTALGTTAAAQKQALLKDLGDFGVQLSGLMKSHGVPEHRAEGLLTMMAEVRAGFEAGTTTCELGDRDQDMQRTGWVHTRVEVLKAARAFDAAVPQPSDAKGKTAHGDKLLGALMGALCSDAFKDGSPHSLLFHNRPGAELVLPLLADRAFDLSEPGMQDVLQTAMKLAHEHQITPPMFMSGAMKGQLMASGAAPEVVEEVESKLNDPLGAPQKDGEIIFSAAAQDAMAKVGVPGWATMDPKSAHFVPSQVVAMADVMQYVAPDGIIKIAVDIRDPEQPQAFMRDANIKAAVGSSVGFSFAKGMEVIIDPKLKAQAQADAETMSHDLEAAIYPEVQARLEAQLGPGAADIPYWNSDVPTDGSMSDEQRASVKLVKDTLRDVLAQHGNVPLDPFGAKE